jgi:hypothetical protein
MVTGNWIYLKDLNPAGQSWPLHLFIDISREREAETLNSGLQGKTKRPAR